MKLVNLGIVCIVLAQCLVFIPCKGDEASCSCQKITQLITQQITQQFTEKLTAVEERLLGAMENRTDAMNRMYCPDSWISFNGSCYLFSKTASTFSSARVFCNSHRSHLVYVESKQENTILKTQIKDFLGSDYWIGLTDMYLEGVFFWYGTGVPTSFADWFPGQPSNYWGNEHCVHCRTINNEIAWNDEPCRKSHRFICEK